MDLKSASRVWRVTPEESRQWAQAQATALAASPATTGYFPRYPFRDRGPDGFPSEDGVMTVSVIAALPSLAALKLRSQLVAALGDLAADPRLRVLPPQLVHLTHSDMPQGRNRSEDMALIEQGRREQETFRSVVADLPAMTLTLNGFTAGPRQIMATFEGDSGWHEFVQTVAELERRILPLSRRYDLTRSPVEPGAKALQATVAVFGEGMASAPILERLAPYLPGPGSRFPPLRWTVQDLRMIVWEHSPRYVCRVADTLAYQQLRRRDGAPRPAWRVGTPVCRTSAATAMPGPRTSPTPTAAHRPLPQTGVSR